MKHVSLTLIAISICVHSAQCQQPLQPQAIPAGLRAAEGAAVKGPDQQTSIAKLKVYCAQLTKTLGALELARMQTKKALDQQKNGRKEPAENGKLPTRTATRQELEGKLRAIETEKFNLIESITRFELEIKRRTSPVPRQYVPA